MNIYRKTAVLLMSIVALVALYKSTVKCIEYQDNDVYGESTESSKFMNSLPENAVVVLMLIGIGVIHKKQENGR